jgi:hypothetical protein
MSRNTGIAKPQEEVPTAPQEKAEPARKLPEPKQNIDWESIPNDQLRVMKTAGAVEEKIYRAFRAIANYNDNAPSNDDRWYIGTTTLSEVSGCNRQAIGSWVKTHQLTVDDHNNKYGLGQYHNKRHKELSLRIWSNFGTKTNRQTHQDPKLPISANLRKLPSFQQPQQPWISSLLG